MNRNVLRENIIDPNVTTIGKNVMLQILNSEIKNIESISSVYHKIDKEKRYKITTIISVEPHYEDV